MNLRFSIKKPIFSSALAFAIVSTLPACSVLVGNVRPMEEPSVTSAVSWSLPAPWREIRDTREKNSQELDPSGLSDLNYQNIDTGSTIAFTSGCRRSYQAQAPSLRAVSQSLGAGLTKIQSRRQIDTETQGIPSLLTTLEGVASSQNLVIQNLSIQNRGCLYDLTLVSLKRHFEADRAAFDTIRASLQIPH